MAKAELGVKRVCLSCSMRFYDFKRSPIVCPGCGTELDLKNLAKGKKSRAVKKTKTKEDVSDGAIDSDGESITDGDGLDKTNDDTDDEIDFEEDADDTEEPSIIRDDLGDDESSLPNSDKKEE